MSDEELVEQIQAARAVGDERTLDRALEELIGRYAETLLTWNLKVPEDRREDLAHDILAAAIRAVLEGRRIEKFSAWLSRVARNLAAEFHRGREGEHLRVARAAARAAHDRDDPASPDADVAVEADYGEVELRQLIDAVRKRLSASHCRVVDLYVFGALGAREVARETGESEANVFKIAQRFRDELRAALEAAERGDTEGSR